MVCSKCFAEIPDTSAFCMECGARLREDTTDPLYAEGSDREVYPEIARANLLRMQGRYEEAVEVCLGILRRYPSNETAHALLGDIYADQGKLPDAIQWYELLVDLAPNNSVYRAKLDNLRAMQTAQQAPTATPPAPPASAPSTRVWVYVLGSLLVLIVVASAFVAGQRLTLAATEQTTLAKPSDNATGRNTNSPAIPPPTQPPAEPDKDALNAAPPFSGMSETEEQLARAISQRLNGLPVWCLFDPLTNRWTVRTRIQAGALTRTRVMQEALLVASVALEQAPSLQSLIITVLTPSTGGADTLLFSAEIGRVMLPPDVHTLTEAQIEAIFSAASVWWNPAVPLPTGSSPTGNLPPPTNPTIR
ncbi:MAG: tetratricopeptide repeat protein [Armatimonadota bacterium]